MVTRTHMIGRMEPPPRTHALWAMVAAIITTPTLRSASCCDSRRRKLIRACGRFGARDNSRAKDVAAKREVRVNQRPTSAERQYTVIRAVGRWDRVRMCRVLACGSAGGGRGATKTRASETERAGNRGRRI